MEKMEKESTENNNSTHINNGRSNNVAASEKYIGVLASSHSCAKGIIKKLIDHQYNIILWSPNKQLHDEIANYVVGKKNRILVYSVPEQLIKSDVVLSLLEDTNQVDRIVKNIIRLENEPDGFSELGYIEMTTTDVEHIKNWYELFRSKGIKYLEVAIQGGQKQINLEQLVLLIAGDEELFVNNQDMFDCIGQQLFLKELSLPTNINLILQTMKGIMLAGVAECIAFSRRFTDIPLSTLDKLFNISGLSSSFLKIALTNMLEDKFDDVQDSTLKEIHQNCLKVLKLSDQENLPLPLTNCLNQTLKETRTLLIGFGYKDAACVYNRLKY